jgi:cytochrome oxidase Cu insertion factor (SCO1/SenC/PrrC family)
VILALLLVLLAHAGAPAEAVRAGIGLDPPTDGPLPLDLHGADPSGVDVRLGDLVDVPVLLTLADLDCRKLCGVATDGLVRSAAATGLVPDRLRVVIVSLDPDDPADAAGAVRDRLSPVLGAPVVVLRTDALGVARLAGALGVRFRRLVDGSFAHPSAGFVVDRDGRVATTVLGLRPDPAALRSAALAAAEGARVPTLGELVLACFRVPTGGNPLVDRWFRLAGLSLVAAVPAALALLVRRVRRRT